MSGRTRRRVTSISVEPAQHRPDPDRHWRQQRCRKPRPVGQHGQAGRQRGDAADRKVDSCAAAQDDEALTEADQRQQRRELQARSSRSSPTGVPGLRTTMPRTSAAQSPQRIGRARDAPRGISSARNQLRLPAARANRAEIKPPPPRLDGENAEAAGRR